MSFEEWLKQWLQEELEMPLKNVVTLGSVAVAIGDTIDTDRFMTNASYIVDVFYEQKGQAMDVTNQIDRVMRTLPRQNFVNGSLLISRDNQPQGEPRGWRYRSLWSIKHRVRDSW